MKENKLILLAVSRFTFNVEYLIPYNMKEEITQNELKEVLNKKNLIEVPKRAKYIWTLDSILENNILKNIHNLKELEIIQDTKNSIEKLYQNISLDNESFKTLCKYRFFRDINDMRAFTSLCDGDLKTYNQYSMNKNNMIYRYIVKTLVIGEMSFNQIESFLKKYKDLLEDTKNEKMFAYEKELKYDWRFRDDLAKSFNEYHLNKKPVYIDGILKIVKETLEELGLYEKVYQAIENKYRNTKEAGSIDIDNDSKEIKIPPSTNKFEKIKRKLLEALNVINDININENYDLEERYNVILAEKSRLEEENKRLRSENYILTLKSSSTSLKEFIQAIGGKEYSYQLTDLYLLSEDIMVDDGNIPGRLINMFALLSNYNIEPFTAGKRIGDIFEIEIKDLAKQYNLESPIQDSKSNIKVELIKYGWKQNNDILVQPLVKQII